MREREPYRPQDARDVGSESAIFAGRSHNGTVAQGPSTTDVLRARLPRGRDVFKTFQSDRGETQSEMLRRLADEADANEAARQNDKLRRAQTEYDEYLSNRQSAAGMGTEDDAEGGEGAVADDERFPDPLPPQRYDANFDRLREEAAKAADEIKALAGGAAQMLDKRPAQPAQPTPSTGTQPGIMQRIITTDDIDQLWDWYRADVGKGKDTPFVGRAFHSSQELHAYARALAVNSTAAIRSIDIMGQLAAFYLLHPIDTRNNVALLHVYTAPALRGRILDLLPYILSGARSIIGPVMNLAIYGNQWDERIGPFLAPYGFKTVTSFVQAGNG